MSFVGFGSDTDGTIVAYQWRSTLDGNLSTAAIFNTTSLTVGNHTIYLKVQDNDGAWSPEASTWLKVNDYPTATIDSISPSPADEGEQVSFVGFGSDTDGTIVAYQWRSDVDGNLSTAASFTSSSFGMGNHTVYLKVQDNDGAWSEWVSTFVMVKNILPIASIGSISPSSLTNEGETVYFSGSGMDASGNIQAYEWKSDHKKHLGVLSRNSSFNVSNLSVGAHNFSFRVKDDEGYWSSLIKYDNTFYVDDGDGFFFGDDKFPNDKTQWSDRDGDGWGDNPAGNRPDAFPRDRDEWLDTDGDGVGDNSDMLVNIPNIYLKGLFLSLIVLIAIVFAELQARNSLENLAGKLETLANKGINVQETQTTLKDIRDRKGVVLLSELRGRVKMLLKDGQQQQRTVLDIMKQLSILREEIGKFQADGGDASEFNVLLQALEAELMECSREDQSLTFVKTMHEQLMEETKAGKKQEEA